MTEPLELCLKGTDTVVAHACGTCRIVAPNRTAAVECCAPRLCSKCGGATGQKSMLVCVPCRDAGWAEDARLRTETQVAKATRIALADYDHEYVCKDADGDEGSYLTVDDAIEEGLTWAWAVTPQSWPHIDAGDLLYNAFEDGYPEGAHENVDEKSLQAVIDAWWATQGEPRFFIVDTKRIVELPTAPEEETSE